MLRRSKAINSIYLLLSFNAAYEYQTWLCELIQGTAGISLAGHTNFSRAEVGGVMGGGKNMYGDYSQVSMSQWNVRNVSWA